MSSSECFKFNQPFVVSEVIDGEAVIMNLKSGKYYSTRHTGALLWSWLERRMPLASLQAGLAETYGGADGDYAAAVTAFIDSLLEQGLIVASDASAVTRAGEDDGVAAVLPPPAYKPPLLEVFADMQDLLLLDPIHDIDEVGWPVAKPGHALAP